jgi:hypothetical protein
MAKIPVALRLALEDLEWIDGYARQRGVSRQVWLESAVAGFRAACEAGVPEFVERARSQAANDIATARNVGVGACPKRLPGLGHIWAGVKASGDESNPCVFCGASGREFFARALDERSELFARLAAPMQSGTGDPGKAYPKGMPSAAAAKAAEIVADKKGRDRVARETGVGRPGQLRGRPS